ncbi:MAG TPA: hypothetical protein VNN73_03575 [Blastocatellia bacterium]|nr:hypothetical protein [Blastocatellia bacterium]
MRNALFFWPLTPKTDFRVAPWTTFTDPEMAHIGLTEREAREKHDAKAAHIYRMSFAENDRAHTEEETRGLLPINQPLVERPMLELWPMSVCHRAMRRRAIQCLSGR